MLKYSLHKLVQIIPMLLLISFIVFIALDLAPVDPISYVLSPDMLANESAVEAAREKYGLNDPVLIRYVRWLGSILRGDLGYSVTSGVPIATTLANRLPATLELSGLALLFSTILGISLGICAAIWQNGPIDYLVRVLGAVGQSIPEFFFGICAIQIFAIQLGWLPVGGRQAYGMTTFWDRAPNLILPVATLTIVLMAVLMRYTRNAMLSIINSDYIKTARSKGIPEWKVYLKHAFRNAIRPILIIVCFRLPLLIGGTVVIESIFSWPGIGIVLTSAITAGDFPVVMITTLLVASAILLTSVLVDILSALLDPRIRLSR